MIRSKRHSALALLLAAALAAGACSSDSTATTATPTDAETSGSDTGTEETTTSAASESIEGTASVGDTWYTSAGWGTAQWSDNVSVTIDDDYARYQSDGLPSHELPDQFLVPVTGSFSPPVTEEEVTAIDTDVVVVASPVDQTITLTPTYAEEPTDTSLGIIGVVISGAQLFNDYEDQDRQFVAVDDNFSIDGVFFADSCNGHPLALAADGTGQGSYHYHGVPYCITDSLDVEGEHSTILGFLVDGFPFYGPKDEGGVTITSDDLDECSGHFGATPEFPEGIYHYHLTEDRSPYTIDCYHGEVEVAEAGGRGAGGPPPGG